MAALGSGADLAGQAASAPVRAALAERLAALPAAPPARRQGSPGAGAGQPLSLDHGEVTDKGSVNQRAVIRNRPDLVAALYGTIRG